MKTAEDFIHFVLDNPKADKIDLGVQYDRLPEREQQRLAITIRYEVGRRATLARPRSEAAQRRMRAMLP